jgi:hypothetical protein
MLHIALPFVLKRCDLSQIADGKRIQRIMEEHGYVLSLEEAIVFWTVVSQYTIGVDWRSISSTDADFELWEIIEDNLPDSIKIG